MILYSKPWGKDIDSGLRLEIVNGYTIAQTYANSKYVSSCQTAHWQHCKFYSHVKDLKCVRIMKGKDVVLRSLLWSGIKKKKPIRILDYLYTSEYGDYNNKKQYGYAEELEAKISAEYDKPPIKADVMMDQNSYLNPLDVYVPLLPSISQYMKKVDKYPYLDTFNVLTYDLKYLISEDTDYLRPPSWYLQNVSGTKSELNY